MPSPTPLAGTSLNDPLTQHTTKVNNTGAGVNTTDASATANTSRVTNAQP